MRVFARISYTCVRLHASGNFGVVVEQQLQPVSAWRAVLLAQSRAMRAIERDLDQAGVIPIAWYDVLLELNAAPDRRLRMQELGMRTVVSRTRVSRIVTELERAGYVDRLADAADGRATLACINESGRAALREAAPVYLRGIEEHFTRYLSISDQRAVDRALQRVIDAHDAVADPRR